MLRAMIFTLLFCLAQVAPGLASVAFALPPDESTIQAASTRANHIADELRSPFCPGKTLLTCTSGQAFATRQEIRDRLLAGESEPQIIADFKLRFGDEIENPEQPWYTILGPLTPLVMGIGLLLFITWRWRRERASQPPEGVSAGAPDTSDTGDDGAPDEKRDDELRRARLRRQLDDHD